MKKQIALVLPFIFCPWVAVAAPLAQSTASLAPEKPHGRLNRPRPVLAVLPFQDANAKAKENGLGISISAMLLTELRNHSNFLVLERSKIAEALGDREATPLGVTQKQIQNLETLYQAEVAITGDVAQWDGAIELDARLVSTRSGEVVAAASGRSDSDKDLRALMTKVAGTLEKKYLRQWMATLIVSCQPVEAEVYLNGDYIGKANAKTSLRNEDLLEGRYRLELVAAGYRSWSDTVDLMPKSVITVNASLSALPGNLFVNSQPVGAEVYLDGKAMGRTPLELKNVAEGEHRLKLELENFYPSEEKVFVNSGQSTQSNAVLRIRMGLLQVATQPAGASVSLNGRYFGKTPINIDKVEPGKVNVEITAEGYRVFQEAFSVKPNDTIVISKDLTLRKGWLTVVSHPRDVRVHLIENGKKRTLGKTPAVKESLNVGEYEVVLEKENYYPKQVPVIVETDEEARLEVYLDRKPGQLLIASHPGTEILVNGAFKGFTPDSLLELPEGKYAVRLHSFHGSSTDSVTIASNSQTRIHKDFPKGKSYLLGTLFFLLVLGGLIAL